MKKTTLRQAALKLALVAFVVLSPLGLRAQQTLTVNDGTATNGRIPFYGYYMDTQGTTSEFIIPADQLGDMEGGTISKLTFYISGSPASWGSPTVQIYLGEVEGTTLSSTNGPTNFTVVYTGTVSNQTNPMVIEFDDPYVYEGGNLLIGTYVQVAGSYKATNFYGVSATSGSSINSYEGWSGVTTAPQLFLPKTTFEYEPAQQGGDVCEKPSTCDVSDVTSTSATLTWSGGSGTYNVEVKGGSYTDWTAVLSNTTLTTTTLTLQPTTSYQARVQSVCDGSTPTSGWKTSASFSTPCGETTLPYFYGFEDASPLACWTMTDCASSTGRYLGTANTDSYCFRFYYGYNDQFLISPELSGTGNGVYFSFYYRQYSSGTETFHVGYSTTTNSTDAFTWGDEMTATTSYQLYENVFPAGTKYVAIKLTSYNQYYLYIDDVNLTLPPTCYMPTAAQVDEYDQTTATISWVRDTRNADGETYSILMVREGDDDLLLTTSTTPAVSISGSTASLTGLTQSTPYSFKVVTNCANTEENVDFVPLSFTTLANCPAPTATLTDNSVTAHGATIQWNDMGSTGYNVRWQVCNTISEGFENGSLNDWVLVNSNTSNTGVVTNAAHNSNYGFKFRYDETNDASLISPVLSGTEDGVTISFYYKEESNSYGDEQFYVGYSTNETAEAPADFTYGNIVTASLNWQLYENSFPAGTKRIAIKYVYNDALALYIDDIDITIPNDNWTTGNTANTNYTITGLTADTRYLAQVQSVCGEDESSWSEGVSFTTTIACPAPTTLAVAANATDATTMVDLTWTMNGAETDWQISSLNGTVENIIDINESDVTITGDNVSYTLTGLIPGQNYTFKVRANCEASVTGDGTSDWSNTESIQTEATCTEPTAFNHGTPDVHSVDLTWTESGTATQWQLCVNDDMDNLILLSSTDDDVNVDGQNVSYTLSGLTGTTNYSVKVRAYCAAGDGNQSPWVSPTEFRTACEAITTFPWREDFESYAAGNFNDPCWVNELISGNGTQIFKVNTSTTGNNTTHQLQLPDMSEGTLTKLVLPEMTLPNANYQFVLDVYRNNSTYNNSYPNEGIRVYASTDGEIEGATELTFIPRQYNVSSTLIPEETAQGWYTYEIPIGISGTCYIILRGESQYCTSTSMDNLTVEEIPSCARPTDLAKSDVTNHSATLTWTAGDENQHNWQVAYSKTSFDPNTASFDINTVQTIDFTTSTTCTYRMDRRFDAASTYYLYIRANCGTATEPDYGPWSRNGISLTTLAAAPAPSDFTASNIASTKVDLVWNAGGGDYELSWDLYYLQSDDAPTAPTEETPATKTVTTLPTTENPYTLDDLTEESRYYIWVRANHGADGNSGWVALTGDFFTTLPSCPTPTALAATNITNNAATISWTGSSDVDNYTVQYREAEGINTNGGLNENFNSLTTANSIPEGWSNDEGSTSTASHKWCYNTSTYGNGATNGTSYDGSNCVRFNSYTNSSNNTNFLQTPSMDFPAGETMMLSFWWKNPTAGDFSVYISTDGGTTKNPIAEGLTGQSTWTQATYQLTDYVGASNVTIHFKGTSNYGNGDAYIYLDDIMVGYAVPAGEWQTATSDVAEESFTIEGLEAETKYDVQVKSNCTNGEYSAPYTFTTASVFTKSIQANKWYAIASPMHNDGNNETLAGVNNLTSGTYDLYGYNEATGTWEKPTTTLNRGKGYIYRRSNDATLQFVGYANTGNVSVSLTSSCSDNDLKGFNLIGNPYPHAVAINQPHYTLNPNGTWTAHASNNTIGVAEAFLVYSPNSYNTYYFSDVTPSTPGNSNTASASLAFTVSNGEYSDVAYARLEEGNGLRKIGHLNSEAPMLSIPVEGSRYAIANLGSDCQSFNLVFRGVNGTYTIKQSSNQAIAYCHLIDRVAGKDIDMLRQNYTFSSNGFDADRFMVKLSPDAQENANGNFAYWNGNSWMVEGNGTLQVFDALGRQLLSQEISNSNFEIQNSLFPAAGVYVLRMGEKTQKIVVR